MHTYKNKNQYLYEEWPKTEQSTRSGKGEHLPCADGRPTNAQQTPETANEQKPTRKMYITVKVRINNW